jgi:hypothetical protein
MLFTPRAAESCSHTSSHGEGPKGFKALGFLRARAAVPYNTGRAIAKYFLEVASGSLPKSAGLIASSKI